ncbi:Transcriptional regulator, LysR family, in glycolate utilization operon [Candidatus Burkholderia pumila]|uniref:Transcriptional regulator, LysR family, in glycolate utilization operon n=1 Tax=Candidatus Burkholderia pumila TaxID=1090375 RepID=A0ABR5HK17_9BURK|nr:Transcriptional regulator, LysR family, in glycolate utilization operon [Candidatus Burkholderia pumila]
MNIESVTLTGPDGAFEVRNHAVLNTIDTSMVLQLVRAGIGLAYFPAWIVEPELAAGSLVRVLPVYDAFAPDVYAVYTSRKYMTTKVRTFIDFLSDALGPTAFLIRNTLIRRLHAACDDHAAFWFRRRDTL